MHAHTHARTHALTHSLTHSKEWKLICYTFHFIFTETKDLSSIATKKEDALSFLSRHKRATDERNREAEEACTETETFWGGSGCFIGELYEIYGNMEKSVSTEDILLID